MNRKKLKCGLITALQVVAMLGIALGAGYFLLRYCAYGEREVSGTVRIRESETENEPVPEFIRIRITDDDFQNELHGELSFVSQGSFTVIKTEREGYVPGDEVDAACDIPEGASDLLAEALRQSSEWNREKVNEFRIVPEDLEETEVLRLQPSGHTPVEVNNLKRAGGAPEYYGELYVWREGEGLALLNVIPLEEYLYSVVSSEMPSDYPLEAQKAQAVCARTYAANCMAQAVSLDLEADVTDSVNDQVYNNYGMTEMSKQAVNDTAGEILPLKDIQYYSTSCLSEKRSDLDSDEAFAAFLSEKPEQGAEYDSHWLRWQTEVSGKELLKRIKEYAQEYITGEQREICEDDAEVVSVTVKKRRGDGQVQELYVCQGKMRFTVEGEYNIRKLLGGPQTEITLMDASQVSGMQLLPSAFFYIEEEKAEKGELNYIIWGGGYGHGNGMSQCGAAALAEKGMDYREIISYYYSVVTDNL